MLTSATAFDVRSGTYSAGLNLDLPIDRVAERNQYRASLITLERADRTYRGLRDQVILDVRDSIRTIFSECSRVTASSVSCLYSPAAHFFGKPAFSRRAVIERSRAGFSGCVPVSCFRNRASV